jgi:pimeloyl-ACP methyl ester carboxylesterase
MKSLARIKAPFTQTEVCIPVSAFDPKHQQPGTWLQPSQWGGQAALVICGAGDNRFAFKWLLFQKLLTNNIAVLTVDPPGHGEFMGVPSTVATAQHAARAASDWLHAHAGVQRVGLVGISFGGNQAAWLMAHDERIAALTIIASPIKLNSVTQKVMAREVINLLWPRNVMILRKMSPRALWTEWKSIRGAWYGESLYDMIEAFDMLNTMQKIGARPTLFVHGARDVAIPVHNAHQLHQAALPDKEIVIVPQATHLTVVMQDKPMQRVADWTREKLNT